MPDRLSRARRSRSVAGNSNGSAATSRTKTTANFCNDLSARPAEAPGLADRLCRQETKTRAANRNPWMAFPVVVDFLDNFRYITVSAVSRSNQPAGDTE